MLLFIERSIHLMSTVGPRAEQHRGRWWGRAWGAGGKREQKMPSLFFSLSQLYLQKDTSSCVSGEDRGKTMKSSAAAL